MYNKKAGVAIEEIAGLLTVMFVAIFVILLFVFVEFISTKQITTDVENYQETIDSNDVLLYFLKIPIKSDLGDNMADFIVQSYINSDYSELENLVKEFFNEEYGTTNLPWDFIIITSSGKEVFGIKNRGQYFTHEEKYLLVSAIIPILRNGDVEYLKIELILGEIKPGLSL